MGIFLMSDHIVCNELKKELEFKLCICPNKIWSLISNRLHVNLKLIICNIPTINLSFSSNISGQEMIKDASIGTCEQRGILGVFTQC